MTTKKPVSFNLFLVIASITALVFIAATIFSYYQADIKYAMYLAFIMTISSAFATVGIYTGFKFKSEESKAKIQNRIGLIGNLLIFLFTVGIMVYAVLKPTG